MKPCFFTNVLKKRAPHPTMFAQLNKFHNSLMVLCSVVIAVQELHKHLDYSTLVSLLNLKPLSSVVRPSAHG